MRKETLNFTIPLAQAFVDYSVVKTLQALGKTHINAEYLTSAHLSLVLTTWRKETNTSLTEVVKNGALDIWSLFRYWINLYDDVVDNSGNTRLLNPRDIKYAPWKENIRVADMTSILVATINDLPLPHEKKRSIFTSLNQFRKEQYNIYQKMYNLPSDIPVPLDRLEETKLLSSSLVMRRMAEVMNYSCDIQPERAKEVEDGFHAYGAVGQWIDDLADFEKDEGSHTNLIVSAMSQFPEEYEHCMRGGFTRKNCRKAVKTMSLVSDEFDKYMSFVPRNCPVLKNSLHFFKDIVPLYGWFETESKIRY